MVSMGIAVAGPISSLIPSEPLIPVHLDGDSPFYRHKLRFLFVFCLLKMFDLNKFMINIFWSRNVLANNLIVIDIKKFLNLASFLIPAFKVWISFGSKISLSQEKMNLLCIFF